MHIKERFMDTNEFDDSLDGSITKPIANPLLLEQQSAKKLTASEIMTEKGLRTEEDITKILEKEGETTASLITKKYDIPERTVGGALERMKRKGLVKDRYDLLMSQDKRRRMCHIYSLVKKNGSKRST